MAFVCLAACACCTPGKVVQSLVVSGRRFLCFLGFTDPPEILGFQGSNPTGDIFSGFSSTGDTFFGLRLLLCIFFLCSKLCIRCTFMCFLAINHFHWVYLQGLSAIPMRTMAVSRFFLNTSELMKSARVFARVCAWHGFCAHDGVPVCRRCHSCTPCPGCTGCTGCSRYLAGNVNVFLWTINEQSCGKGPT